MFFPLQSLCLFSFFKVSRVLEAPTALCCREVGTVHCRRDSKVGGRPGRSPVPAAQGKWRGRSCGRGVLTKVTVGVVVLTGAPESRHTALPLCPSHPRATRMHALCLHQRGVTGSHRGDTVLGAPSGPLQAVTPRQRCQDKEFLFPVGAQPRVPSPEPAVHHGGLTGPHVYLPSLLRRTR